jgi:hypothetical protein
MGVLITLESENITYRAALLAGPDGYSPPSRDKRRKQSTYLPLLLTRLPNALRQTFVQFLSTTFDTYCAVLRLPPSFLAVTLSSYMSSLTENENSSAVSRSMLETVMKETHLTLSFAPSIAPSLKALDINLPRETLSTLALDRSSRLIGDGSSVFLASLSQYLDKHLAMKVDITQSLDPNSNKNGPNQHVLLSKVASGAFVLSAEGRLKLVASPDRHASGDHGSDEDARIGRLILNANEEILRALVRRAVGVDMPT